MLEAIGATLRAAREARGWTIEEVERATRIRARYLLALERGEYDALPSSLQARGFLRNYAQHLGLNSEQTLSQLDEALRPQRSPSLPSLAGRGGRTTPAINAVAPVAPAPASPLAAVRRLRRLFTPDILIMILVGLGVLAFFVWGGLRLANTVFNPVAITPTAEVLGPTDTLSPTIIAGITPSFTPPPPVINFSNIQLILQAEQRTFVRVTVDGNIAFEGLLRPDDRKDFVANNFVEVTTGNGAGVRIFFNQQDLGTMGGIGEVVSRQYTLQGMITLTPTITLTPSLTLTPSETPTPTAPPTDTPVPTPTRTPQR
jgi:hypothetical protein